MNMFLVTISIGLLTMNTINCIPLNQFFPFGAEVNDHIFRANDDECTNALPLPKLFPYFNNNYRQIYLANNGLFSFLGPVFTFVPIPFPLGNNWLIIAGFWSDIDTRGIIPNGNLVYYNIHHTVSSQAIFEKAALYTQQYFPTERAFFPTMVITGTWYQVGAYSMQTSLRNTFQIVLATDEIRSFAFLLYHDLQWASPSGVFNSSNSTSGIGAQAGFNAGDGIVFEMLPYSRTSRVRELVNMSNVNVPGLFVYRIDTETISLGGCGNSTVLSFVPHHGSQLGSTAITISGPCFTNTTESAVKCRFGESVVVNAIVINQFQAICLTPPVAVATYTNIYLSVDGGITYNLAPYLFNYVPAEFGYSSSTSFQVTILNQTNLIVAVTDQIHLGWDLTDRIMEILPNDTIRIDIQMCFVSLNESNGGITEMNYILIQSDIEPQVGFQSISATIPSIGPISIQTVFFRVIARNKLTNQTYAGFNSPLVVVHNNLLDTAEYCFNWTTTQPKPSTWNADLYNCPLSLVQARGARCCYQQDQLCHDYSQNSSGNCILHKSRLNYEESSAISCYISRTSNQWNAGTECCYDSDGQLINLGVGAGTDDRYHPILTPILHFFSDILPYLSCCILTTNDQACSSYFDFRPTRRGSSTRFPWGGTWGDPHFLTLDGSSYTFNGYGEYTYLAITNSTIPKNTPFHLLKTNLTFNSQIRTAPIDQINTYVTLIRGFSAKSNQQEAQNMSIIVTRREQIIVRRGNETLDLTTENNSLTLFYPELTLEKNHTDGSLTLSWFIGVSFRIRPIQVQNHFFLNIEVSIDDAFQNRTCGLLGLFDNNPENDLLMSNGTIVGPSNTLTIEQIHRLFGRTWSIDPFFSLFYYETGDTPWNYFIQNQVYTPLFSSTELSSSEINSILATCNIDSTLTNRSQWTLAQQTCFYDVSITNESSIGQASMSAANDLLQISLDQRFPPEFSLFLPLMIDANISTPITINFTATSIYDSCIRYQLIEGPESATFDNQTGSFHWQNPYLNNTNQTVIRVSAVDTHYNLSSKYALLVRVSRTGTNIVSQASTLCCRSITFIIFSFSFYFYLQ